jgi:hypothetical protein
LTVPAAVIAVPLSGCNPFSHCPGYAGRFARARLRIMAADGRSPEQYAAEIDAARDRLIAFVESCTAGQWKAAPLDGDPRPVGVVADHVAHAYEYLTGWMRQLLAGEALSVDSDQVDALNAEHAVAASGVTQAEVAEHLRRSGAVISALVAGCTAEELQAGDGRIESFARVAIRHPDNHRAEIEAALAASAGRGVS